MNDHFFAADVSYTAKAIDDMLTAYPELLEDESLRADMLEAETDLPSIASKILRVRGERLAYAEGLNLHIKVLTERRDRFARGADGLKGLLLRLMATAQLPKLTLPEATVSVTAGRKTVSIEDVEQLPQGTFTLVRQPDKAVIKAMIDAGDDVPGAALVTSENSLTVRVK
jgi:hypothetical protein